MQWENFIMESISASDGFLMGGITTLTGTLLNEVHLCSTWVFTGDTMARFSPYEATESTS